MTLYLFVVAETEAKLVLHKQYTSAKTKLANLAYVHGEEKPEIVVSMEQKYDEIDVQVRKLVTLYIYVCLYKRVAVVFNRHTLQLKITFCQKVAIQLYT